jgi:lipopolysaccharide transport system permease protein
LIVLEFVLILGLAYPVAAINVWFRDTQPVLRIALQLLFYLTPVFYETKNVPSFLSWFYRVNPVAHLADAFRS